MTYTCGTCKVEFDTLLAIRAHQEATYHVGGDVEPEGFSLMQETLGFNVNDIRGLFKRRKKD